MKTNQASSAGPRTGYGLRLSLSRGGGLAEIGGYLGYLGYLGILAAYAVGLLAIASLRLRRSLVTP